MFLFYAIEHFYKEKCRICAKIFKICEIFVKKASFDLKMPQITISTRFKFVVNNKNKTRF